MAYNIRREKAFKELRVYMKRVYNSYKKLVEYQFNNGSKNVLL